MSQLWHSLYANFMFCLQASEIENLMQEKVRLAEEKDGLEIQSQKLAEEASYAKELASAAAVELRHLAEEVTKLSYQNAKLTSDLVAAKEAASARISSHRNGLLDVKQDACLKKGDGHLVEELQKELLSRCQREASLEAALSVRDKREADLLKRIEEGRRREEDLENELANMWVLVAKSNKSEASSVGSSCNGDVIPDLPPKFLNGFHSANPHPGAKSKEGKLLNAAVSATEPLEEVKAAYESERRKRKELESVLSRLKVRIVYPRRIYYMRYLLYFVLHDNVFSFILPLLVHFLFTSRQHFFAISSCLLGSFITVPYALFPLGLRPLSRL